MDKIEKKIETTETNEFTKIKNSLKNIEFVNLVFPIQSLFMFIM
jgi:hypothetical protein